MKELVEFIAKSIVDNPEEVEVTEEEREDGRILIKLNVAEEDKGKVIGRRGHVAESMRTLLRIVAVKQGKRTSLEIP
jgi:predicted RNA-binding protein YlqC (UPF0109 family)